jgi:hypothetical protein
MEKHDEPRSECRQVSVVGPKADTSDRNRWMAMARFWLQRGKEVNNLTTKRMLKS